MEDGRRGGRQHPFQLKVSLTVNSAPSASSYLSDYGYSAINGNSAGNGFAYTQNGLVTYGIAHNLATEFLAVQLVFFNDTNTALQIGGASVAATANTAGDPMDSSGNAMPQVRVTFSNGGKDVDFATQQALAVQAAPSGALVLNMPGSSLVTGACPALFYSDWTPLISIERSDKGPGRLLHARVMAAAGQSMRTKLLNQSGGVRPDPLTGVFSSHFHTGRTFDAWKANSDTVTGAPTGFTNTHNDYSTPLWAVRYLTHRGVFNVLITGESVFQGYGSDSGTESFAVLGACAAHTEAHPVEVLALGQGSENTQGFVGNALSLLGTGHIGLTICPAWDGNDALNTAASWAVAKAQVDDEWPRVMALASACRLHGSALAISTPIPNCGAGWQEAARLYQSQRIRGLASRSDVTVVDMETLFGAMNPPPVFKPSMMTTAPTVFNSFKPAAHTPDGIHPGQSGHTYASALYAALIRNIVAGATIPS